MDYRNQSSHPGRHSQPPKQQRRRWYLLLLLALVAVGVLYGGFHKTTAKKISIVQPVNVSHQHQSAAAVARPVTTAPVASVACSGATQKNIIVSISQRHLWVCDSTAQMYDSAVVTGMESLPADLTPVGTYHISAKYTDRYLRGSDSTGSWNDYVHYWMPWLHNQYGNYGFHDATWRDPSAFGNIDPNSTEASHGCVELPLTTAAWLYNWATVGTTVTIKA